MRPSTVGQTVYPGGRKIDVSSRHDEWTAYAANAVNAHDRLTAERDALVAALQDALDIIDTYIDVDAVINADIVSTVAIGRAALAQALPAVAEADGVES